MDEIKYFEAVTSYQSEELPWVKDWAKSNGESNIPQIVQAVYKGDKGLLLTTNLYKSFVFKREQIHAHLIEALDSWVKSKSPTAPLIINVNGGSKVLYGINRSKKPVIWTLEETKYEIQLRPPKKSNKTGTTNPFLQSNNPTHQTATDSYTQEEEDANDPGGANRGV